MNSKYYKVLGIFGFSAMMFTLVAGCGSSAAAQSSRNSGELLKTPKQVNESIIQYLRTKGIRDISLPQLPPLHQRYYGVTVITDAKLPDSFVVQLTSMPRPYPLNAFAVNQSHLPMADLLGSYAVKPEDQKDEQVGFGGGLVTGPKGIASSYNLLELQHLHGPKRFAHMATGITGTVYNTGHPYFPTLEFSYGHWKVIVSELFNVHAGAVIGRELLQEIGKRGSLPGSGTFWVEMAGDGDHTQLAWTVNGKSYNIATQDTPELALNWLSHWSKAKGTAEN